MWLNSILNKLFPKYDLDDSQIYSNKRNYCARCEQIITKENSSGWEVFINGHITQPICKKCNDKETKEVFQKA